MWESLLGVHVDLLTPADLPPKFRAKVLAEAQPIKTKNRDESEWVIEEIVIKTVLL